MAFILNKLSRPIETDCTNILDACKIASGIQFGFLVVIKAHIKHLTIDLRWYSSDYINRF